MTAAKIVFIHGLPPRIVDLIVSFNPDGFSTTVVDGKIPEEEQIATVRDADFIMAYRAKLTPGVLRSARKARLVQILSAGYDGMDLRLLRELKLPCANNGGANSWAVADHAVLAMLALYRRLSAADKAVREGRWSAAIDGTNTFEMAGKLVGILGFGNIGQKVTRRVQSFDATVQYYDLFPLPPECERDFQVKRVALDELFRTSDIVSCHAPLTKDTRHIVSREHLALMKPAALLINTSRGPVVDEPALIEALRQKRIAGAGLDVFEKEPVDKGNPLLEMENVIVTPHSAGTTWDTWVRRADFAYRNFRRVWAGESPLAVAQDYDV
ncbi:MAG TPA: 2-hydroxyacid dehydrogenase [Burkholderiales bacterium]|jgi:phosphoglycerate dehydrogenase-like enzyme|nr:2-hydroxyacid dehydrogenase [Burkholderiales bacterium]